MNPEELRKQWFSRYMTVQSQADLKIRTVLIQAAEDAYKALISETSKNQFSAGVRSAQIRLTMEVIKEILNDVYKKVLPILQDGSKKAAAVAVVAFGELDRRYLEAALGSTGNVSSFIDGQRLQAQIGVAHAVSRITNSDIPLSRRVYRTRSLSSKWVQRTVTSDILRGASAREIAKDVRSSIRPDTPGGVSYAAMRLGRTEINNAFHATSITLSQDRPWVENMAWHLSKVHEHEREGVPEICEIYASQTFHVENVPAKPHPQCRCFVTPELEPFETFLTHLTAGQYRDWIGNAA